MNDIAIHIENLSKRYRIGARGKRANTLRERLGNLAASPFDYLRSTLRGPTEEEIIWALKDVSFEVKQGEVVGIIGRNGAGKTTLLKILSRITEPAEGRAEINGRVGSLLEVGTGFHPELTGRENVYLNGAILGMKRAEIDRKFDEIVDFSGVEKFIDTPVKRYSSGMYVRLAFAVAAHLEPEILLVDEVLAVGDAAFQQKCLGKMQDVAKEGRTVLFVSHNMGVIQHLCKWAILLDQGHIVAMGDTSQVVDTYLTQSTMSASSFETDRAFEEDISKIIQIRRIRLLDHKGRSGVMLDNQHPIITGFEFEVRQRTVGARLYWLLDKADGTPVCHSLDTDIYRNTDVEREPGSYVARVEFPGQVLNAGAYKLRVAITNRSREQVYDERSISFHLVDASSFGMSIGYPRVGILLMPLSWQEQPGSIVSLKVGERF